jgi:hypothetical protein
MGFEQQVAAFRKKAERAVVEAVKQIVIGMFTDIVTRTPVDTGCARASWRIGLGKPDTTHEPTGGNYPDPASVAMQQTAKLNNLTMQDLKQPIYISNALPYALSLEYGHSQQAPNGMIRVTVEDWKGKGFKLTFK